MHRTLPVSAIAIGLLAAVVCGSQSLTPAALPETLRTHLKAEQFGLVTSVRGLPLGVRDALQTLFGSQALDIAEPGAAFQVTDVTGDSSLPSRRLVAAGCSIDHHCLVYYERGGSAHTWHVTLFHWRPDATRFVCGGLAPAGLATIDDVRSAILSGAIKDSPKFW